MKIVSLKTKITYDFEPRKSGENAGPCPECNDSRKSKNKKSFSWNAQKLTGYCQHCQASFVEYKPFREEKQYFVPEWKNITELSEKAVKYFEGRMISQATIHKMRIYSAIEFMPQAGKEQSVICFPYFKDLKLINIKFRDALKNFKLVKDAELILYNINALKDAKEIIITEGEFDCISYVECGFENCISVPNGAGGSNLDYLNNYIELFDTVEKIYLATDNDIKGIELREELIRRFGPEKCMIISFNDCKDANEYLIKHGGKALAETIKNAYEVPVEGIVNLDNSYDEIYSMYLNGIESGKTIGMPLIDDRITWELGRLAIVTGIPGHGKSEFVDQLVTKMNIEHGWKAGYFSPENYPVKYHYSKLAEKISGKKFNQAKLTNDEFEQVFDYISDNFHFIYPEEDMSFDNILTKAKFLVKKYGIKILVIDPFNKIEHLKDRGESETEYISRFLDRLITFAKRNNVLVFLVAHPRKMEKLASGLYAVPNLYDINGSANFYNKADYGLVVYRNFGEQNVIIDFLKIKFRHLGDGGRIVMQYNYINGRYEPEGSVDNWDMSNYLNKEPRVDKQVLPVSLQFEERTDMPAEPNF